MAFSYGDYEQSKNDVNYKHSADSAANAYGRFISQQRGSRKLGDMSRQFGRDQPKYKSQFGQRGLSGPGIQSGVMQQSMQNYMGDYSRNYGRSAQDSTRELQQYDLNQSNMNAYRQNALQGIEIDKASQIANEAAQLQNIRDIVGGL